MTDYVKAASDALAQRRELDDARRKEEAAENDRRIQAYCNSWGPRYSAALATALGADPAEPEFTTLTWTMKLRPDVGWTYLVTEFQGIPIQGGHPPAQTGPDVVPELGVFAEFGRHSWPFSDLAEFGDAIEKFQTFHPEPMSIIGMND